MKRFSPVIVNVPHSSVFIPEEELRFFDKRKLSHELMVMTDHFCDNLFDAGSEMLRFPVSRLVCDFERFRDDADEPMAAVGMGVCYEKCSDLSRLRCVSQKHKEELLRKYYDTYHKMFELSVEERLGVFGRCLIIDGHSFHASPLTYEPDQNPERPDICIGTDEYHTPQELSGFVADYFEKYGYTVAINRPFAGTILPMKYYRKDPRVKSLMIEINRRLYMDADGKIIPGYAEVKKAISDCLEIMRESACGEDDYFSQ